MVPFRPADVPPARRARPCSAMAAGVLAIATLTCVGRPAQAGASSEAATARFQIPSSARQLVVVSSPTYDPAPPGYLASFRTFRRANATSAWKPVFRAWRAETGSGDFRDVRREGDHATPTGVFSFGLTMYGNGANPGGLHEAYHHLVCGDWWDEDPYSGQYNRFVHVACGSTPPFASWSEALWTDTHSYRYFAVIDFNDNPTVGGPDAPGSGIFLHAWMYGPTQGCLALPVPELLDVLGWLDPADHPVIEIGTAAEVGRVPPLPA